ncbi:hypothetical protein AgCh_021679 [Apium graveolens]
MVRNFFDTGVLLESINMTNIVLIPKKRNPSSLTELRPIALCNVVMKIITKVISNRLKKVLDSVISVAQSEFLPGRLIFDNIMMSFEVMHYLKRKKFRKEGYMALKLDMSKAYDRIEWKFLRELHFGGGIIKNKPWHVFTIARGKEWADYGEETEQAWNFSSRVLRARAAMLSGRAAACTPAQKC